MRRLAAFIAAHGLRRGARAGRAVLGRQGVEPGRHASGRAQARRVRLGSGGRPGRPDRRRRQPDRAARLRLSQRRRDRVHDGQHRQARARDADRHLHDPAEGQGPPLVQVQRRARCPTRSASPGTALRCTPAVCRVIRQSHGCVHLPSKFAEDLFGVSHMGMTVVVVDNKTAPADVVHPAALAPVDPSTGADDIEARLQAGETSRWQPEKSPEGPVSIVMSGADQRVIVLRNGIEIGRARAGRHDPRQAARHARVHRQGRRGTGDSVLPARARRRATGWPCRCPATRGGHAICLPRRRTHPDAAGLRPALVPAAGAGHDAARHRRAGARGELGHAR